MNLNGSTSDGMKVRGVTNLLVTHGSEFSVSQNEEGRKLGAMMLAMAAALGQECDVALPELDTKVLLAGQFKIVENISFYLR